MARDAGAGSVYDSPLDRALTLEFADEHEAALRWLVGLLRADPRGPVNLLAVSRALSLLDHHESAERGLELCVQRALDEGNLPLAVAACAQLRELGGDPSSHYDVIAATFCKGAARTTDAAPAPPQFPGQGDEVEPLKDSLSGEELLSEAESALDEAAAAWDRDRAERSEAPGVRPQAFFSSLGRDALRAMIEQLSLLKVPRSQTLVEEGTVGSEAYFVARGALDVVRHADEESPILLAKLGAGALFGEMALLSRAPRAASVVAQRPSLVLVATKEALESVAADEPEVGREFARFCQRRMVENLVRTSSLLRAVKSKDRPALIEQFQTRSFESGDRVITQGEESEGLHLVASGEVVVVADDDGDETLIARLGPGEVVGEVALVLRRPSNAHVVAAHPTVTLLLPRESFLDVVKQHPALFAELYEIAVRRDEETSSIVAQEATEADDLVLL